jgi:SNF2 family DNA or RNA helicase
VMGDTSKDDRLHIFDDLQANKYKMLIAQPKTISHGLTLTTSNVILWFTPIDSHETYDQFNGRIRRPGQARKTYIVHFVCSALERSILQNVDNKKERQDTLLKYLEGNEY